MARTTLMLRGITLLLLAFHCSLHRVSGCLQGKYQHRNLCCTLCPQGTHVVSHCTENGGKTKCAPCENGTFMKEKNNQTECKRCRQASCGHGLKLVRKCSPLSDNQCNCVTEHYFLYVALLSCMPCTSCKEGQYPVIKCAAYHNARCKKCPKGTFSNQSRNYDAACNKCTLCVKYKQRCTSTEDAVCDTTPPTTSVATEPMARITALLTHESTVGVAGNEKDETRVTLSTTSIAILAGVIAFTLLSLAVICFAWKRLGCPKTFKFYKGKLLMRQYTPLRTGLLFRDLAASTQMEIHKMLNPLGNGCWKDLAANLGNSRIEIRNFENPSTQSAERMLDAWSTSNSATVDRLHAVLFSMGREDVARYLEESIP